MELKQLKQPKYVFDKNSDWHYVMVSITWPIFSISPSANQMEDHTLKLIGKL